MLNAHLRPVNLVVAVDTAGGYSKNKTIPWDVPEDMKRFKELTTGGICIMGRHTYTDMIKIQQSKRKGSAPEGPRPLLPDRESFVISSNPQFEPVGAKAATSITNAIHQLKTGDSRDIFILGGHRLFVEALGRPCHVHMSVIKGDPYQCDKIFPLEIINKRYKIASGEETEFCYNVVYHPIPQRQQPSQREIWEKVLNENFRAVGS